LLAVISLFCILGCNEDQILEEPGLPKVIDVTLQEGAIIAGNAPIIVTFNKKMESVDISVSCTAGTTTLGSNRIKATWMFKPFSPPGFETVPWDLWCCPSPGHHTLMVNGRDTLGQNLEEFTPINFIISKPD